MIDGDLSKYIARIYSSVNDADALASVVEGLIKRTGSSTALVAAPEIGRNSLGKTLWFGDLGTRQMRGVEAVATIDYQDPTLRFFARRPGARYFDTALDLDASAFEVDPYTAWHREHFRGTHWTVGHSQRSSESSFGIALHLSDPTAAHTSAQRTLFRILYDHFDNAHRLATYPSGLLESAEAILVLDARARMTGMTAAAERLIAKNDGIVLLDGRPMAEDTHQRRNLDALLASALSALEQGGSGGAIALDRGSGLPALIALVEPLPVQAGLGYLFNGAIIRLVDRSDRLHASATDRWRALWGLTRAEARVAAVLIDLEFDLRRGADRLGITYGTIRTQLASILSKTDCHSQPQLTLLLARVAQ